MRLGEVALVDRESRIGQLGRVFYETLLDENATSQSRSAGVRGGGLRAGRLAHQPSGAHVDFMVGEDHVDVTGITRAAQERVPLLRGGIWQI